MPKRTDIKTIMILGAGPIIIGQACEFDYSGAQACKALKEEGYRVVLVNSNPATIMTDPVMADATYIEPLNWKVLERIIAKEKPDAILPTMGGQTALNLAMDLNREGILEKYGVELIGAKPDVIDKAEDRQRFKEAMEKIGLESARSGIAYSMAEALEVQQRVGFPAVIRPSFTLGGSGGGIAYNMQEFVEICERGLALSPTHELLIEESLLGWKEYEMEVVRDKADNCIIICSIAHGRFDHGGAGSDAYGSRVPIVACCFHCRVARKWRGDGRLQCAVCGQSEKWPSDRHRNESARLALLGTGFEGNGVPDCQDRRQACRGLYA